MFFRKTKKAATAIILSLFIFSSFFEFLISAQPVRAQLSVGVVADAGRQISEIKDMIVTGLKVAVMNAAQQSVSYFLRKIAYDSAVWIASGGKGQSPFAHTKGVGDYLKSVGSDAAGVAIENLGKGFGLDLCKMPDVRVDLAFRIGLHYNYGVPSEPAKPACNLETFQQNWSGEAFASRYGNGTGGVDPSKIFSSSLAVDDTDLGISLKATEKIDRLYMTQQDSAKADRAEGAGFKPLTNLIDGRIKTPSQVVKQEAEANTPSEQNKQSQTQIASALGSGTYQIIPSTLSLFLNTLSSQMLKNFKENGMLPFGVGCIGSKCPSGSKAANPNSSPTEFSGRTIAELTFNEFLTTKLGILSDYDVLSQLSSCESRGLYNCRIDNSLSQALQEAKHGDPVTIAQAMQKNWLHADWKLIPPTNQALNSDSSCYGQNYCYSNIAVLRQLGILPLGFQIAAKNSDPDRPITLGEVVKKFSDCNYQKDPQGNIVGVQYDPINFPYCHLIDPNWVLKIEQTSCEAYGFGPIPSGNDVPTRLQECSNLKTCVGKDKDGNCAGYGYCTREKNVWKFDADKCDAQYASCRVFTNTDGQSQSVSYLYRTLDTGSCTQENVGCTAYSLDQGGNGWKDVATKNYSPYSSGIFLNKNVSTCSEASAGCSAFRTQTASGEALAYLKKAPDYLNCYDTDANPSNGTQWPQTFSDLFKLKANSACSQYAAVCIADEVGCSLYQDLSDPFVPAVPGKFTPAQIDNNVVTNWNDQCDAKCVGYGAYQEMPTEFSAGNPLAYIIPPSKYNNNQSGQTCSYQDVGCSSFTNMESTSAGGEKVEYFTKLRACIKPDTTVQKNFYTYEGSIEGGYQLQAYTLEKDASGGPAVSFVTPEEKNAADQFRCNEDLYKKNQADPDCRQFNDDQGQVYYRLLPNTIVVSADCTQYRLNSSELAGENSCFGSGVFKDGACYYMGLPGGKTTNAGESTVCSASAVSCRAYKGNHGNNIKAVKLDNIANSAIERFEDSKAITVANGWSATNGNILWSGEATKAYEHSLQYNGSGSLVKTVSFNTGVIDQESNQNYTLSFWAKGSGVSVDVSVKDASSNNILAGTISAGNSWKAFKLNAQLPNANANTTTLTISFVLKGSGSLLLDNIYLNRVSDYIYLVKDSLKVDPVCDDNPTDNLPGNALGCNAYGGPVNSLGDTSYYLTNFSYLCRDGAIGCNAFRDTYNKISDIGARAYNVYLAGTGGTKVSVKIGIDNYSCQIEKGKGGCYINVKGHNKTEIDQAIITGTNTHPQFVDSSYFVPSDATATDTVYLVANDQGSCNQIDVGCTMAGKKVSTPAGVKYVTTTVKLNPNLLDKTDSSGNAQTSILCQKEAIGCAEYSTSKGNVYFKDPVVSGAKVCTFQVSQDKKSNTTISGWFWKGVGVCGTTTTLSSTNCTIDSDCSAAKNETCQKINQVPCYADYKKNGNYYDIWSFGDVGKYQNFVGECPASQDTCTELIDRADNDQSYYYLDNGKLKDGNCSGQVSQKAGCVLFDQTDNPNKYYDTAATYAKSDSQVYDNASDDLDVTKVTPLSSVNNNANRVIQVKRDRECGEWLQCVSSHSVFDSVTGKWKNVCDNLGLCDQLSVGASDNKNNLNNCANFLGVNQQTYGGRVVSEGDYAQRDVSWKGKDWAGYSILGNFLADELSQLNVGNESNPVWTLGRKISCGGVNCLANSADDTACNLASKPAPCGKNNIGTCINGVCFQNINGTPVTNVDLETIKKTCRAYPEDDAPFPNTSALKKSNQFIGSNICAEGTDGVDPQTGVNGLDSQKCECSYSKVSYGQSNLTRYFTFNYDKNPKTSGLCVGGKNDGKFCNPDNNDPNGTNTDCPQSGQCQAIKKNSQLVGWDGYCLEYDLSRTLFGDKNLHPCLSWLPVDTLSGSRDVNYQHKEAGFQPSVDGTYCYKGNLFARPKTTATNCDKGCVCPAGYSLQANNSCLADFAVPFNKTKFFGDYTNVASNKSINCEKPLVIDDTLIAATDQIWKKGVELAGNNYLTQAIPYAIATNPGDYDVNLTGAKLTNGLIKLPWCENPPYNYQKPVSDLKTGELSCPSNFKLAGSNIGGSYNAWSFKFGLDLIQTETNIYYANLCNSDTDCQADDTLKAEATSNGFCMTSCFPDANGYDTDNCGKGVKCILYNGKNICSQGSGNIKFDYSSLTSDSAELKEKESWDPCVMGYAIGGYSFTGNYESRNKAQQICTQSGGIDCLFQTNIGTQSSCSGPTSQTAPPVSCSYAVIGPVRCIDSKNNFISYSTSTYKTYNSEFCGSPGKKVVVCESRPAPGIGEGEDYGLDLKIKMCSNIATPNTLVAKVLTSDGPQLQTLIASAQKTFSWIFDPIGKTVKYQPDDSWAWNSTMNLDGKQPGQYIGVNSAPPVVHPVSDECTTDDRCKEIKQDGLTIKNVWNKDAYVQSNSEKVVMKFFASADKNHMPIKKMVVNWDDGTDPINISPAFIRNAKGEYSSTCNKSTGKCESLKGESCGSDTDCQLLDPCVEEGTAKEFGSIVNKTCDNNYFRFEHTYQCNSKSTPAYDPKNNKGGWSETCPDSKVFPNGCCVFKPRVQVMDNWNWCNGVCPGGDDKTDGCYDNIGSILECSFNPKQSQFTYFKGNVLVAPSKN